MAVTTAGAGLSSRLDRFFKITERGSTMRTELIAGGATWLTMSYILFVNPTILGFLGIPDLQSKGLPFGQVLTVTALVAGCMTLLMGIYANYPFALAAGLGLNAFMAFVNAGVVVHPQSGEPIVTINPNLTTLRMLVFVIGFVITGALVARRMKGALLGGIVLTTVIGMIINYGWAHKALWASLPGVGLVPSKWIQGPDFGLVGKFSFDFFSALGTWTAIAVVLSVMLSDFFDTMGTVVGIAGEAKLLTPEGKLPGINRVLLVDSLAAAAGGAASASSNTTYIESAAGVSEGGRTGLTSVVVGVLFLLSLFLSSLAGIIPPEATAPILVIVGYFMMTIVKDINWQDPGIGIPALLTVVIMPFTFSITNGVGAGFLSYLFIAVLRGKIREVHPLMWVVSGVFAWYFIHGVV